MTDSAHRIQCYIDAAVENELAAAQMAQHYATLRALAIDEFGEDVLHITYMRITRRYTGGDFVRQFTRLYYNTRRELSILMNKETNGIYQQAEEEERET